MAYTWSGCRRPNLPMMRFAALICLGVEGRLRRRPVGDFVDDRDDDATGELPLIYHHSECAQSS